MVAQLKPSLDNLAIDDRDRIFVSNMADNGIQEVDPETGAAKQMIIGKLALPGGIGVVSDDDRDTIYIADVFAYRTVDGATGEVSEPARMHADGGTLEYPMSATARGDEVILSSWFTGTVQVIDRKTGKTKEMMHGSRRRMTRSGSATAAFWSTNSAPVRWSASAASTARTARRFSAGWRVRSDWSRQRETRSTSPKPFPARCRRSKATAKGPSSPAT